MAREKLFASCFKEEQCVANGGSLRYESFAHQRESIRRVVAREQVPVLQPYRRPLLCLHLLCSTKFYTFNTTMYGGIRWSFVRIRRGIVLVLLRSVIFFLLSPDSFRKLFRKFIETKCSTE